MNETNFVYNEYDNTMVFTVDSKRHVRVAYDDGRVWYAMCDIAKLYQYRAPSKVVSYLQGEIRLLRVPHTSQNVRGWTNCKCVTKDTVIEFVESIRTEPELNKWLLREVIPKAEQKFGITQVPKAERETTVIKVNDEQNTAKVTKQVSLLLDMLDQFIISAVSLRQEIQRKT
ncbi:MAG: hypothetical protein LBN43_04245 [Oscillospiraceae bacterium]|nr:hypothetical protein [Oscillospiraceae bacterium]